MTINDGAPIPPCSKHPLAFDLTIKPLDDGRRQPKENPTGTLNWAITQCRTRCPMLVECRTRKLIPGTVMAGVIVGARGKTYVSAAAFKHHETAVPSTRVLDNKDGLCGNGCGQPAKPRAKYCSPQCYDRARASEHNARRAAGVNQDQVNLALLGIASWSELKRLDRTAVCVELSNQGISVESIAERFDLRPKTVYGYLARRWQIAA